MYIFAIFLAEVTKHTSSSYINKLKNDILNIPFAIKEVVSLDRQTKLLAKKILNEKHNIYRDTFIMNASNEIEVLIYGYVCI